MYFAGVMTLALTHGSAIDSISPAGGRRAGLSTTTSPRPAVSATAYSTDGAEAIRSRSNSRSSRSWTISMCSKPRKPQRKPVPSATDVSGANADRGVVEVQFLERVAQLREVLATDWVDARENERLGRLVAGQRLDRPDDPRLVSVSPTWQSRTLLRPGRDVTHFARAELRRRDLLRAEDAQLEDLAVRA